jgi:hypothetical protein
VAGCPSLEGKIITTEDEHPKKNHEETQDFEPAAQTLYPGIGIAGF